MSSAEISTTDTDNKKGKVLLWALWLFIAVPIVWFLVLLGQGIFITLADKQPQDVVAVQITKSTANITWVTNTKSAGTVEYGTSPSSLTLNAEEVEPKKDHEVSLTLLSPQTIYYYQITIDGKVFDNDGLPWSFTTKTKDGTDVAEAVKGVSTRKLAPEEEIATEPATLSTSQCTSINCEEIKANLGHGCSASDYFKCIANLGSSTSSTGNTSLLTTPTPTPTPAIIMSNKCKVLDLYVPSGGNCTNWSWTSYATHPAADCRDAFYQYIVQCNRKDFNSTNTEDKGEWYFNKAINNRTTDSIELTNEPREGSTVYCQIRVEDPAYNASQWVPASAVCKY